MPLTIPAETLRHSFGLCHPFAPRRTTNDALKYIRLAIRADCLEMIAGNGETSIAHKITGLPFPGKTGDIMLPAERVGQVLSECDAAEFDLDGDREGEIALRGGANEWRLQTISAKEYPDVAIPQVAPQATSTISAKELRYALDMTVWAVADDSVRYALGAVRLEAGKSSITFVATDARRLSTVESCASGNEDFTFLLRRTDAKRIIAATETVADAADVVICRHSSRITFALGMSLIVCREVEGSFPDWRGIVPKSSKAPCALLAGPLTSGLRQARLGRENGETAVKLLFTEGTLRLWAGPVDALGSKIDLPISYDGDKIEIAFNPDYLIQWLGALDRTDQVDWHMTDGESPVLMACGNARYLVMPLKSEEQE